MHSLLFFSSKIGNVGNIDFEMDILGGPWSKGNAEIKEYKINPKKAATFIRKSTSQNT